MDPPSQAPQGSSARTMPIAMAAVLAAGAALMAVQYAAGPAMFRDDLAIALQVVHNDLASLILNPLGHVQLAPPGFLVLEKLGVALLAPNEWGFRLFPFAFGVGALFLFWRVAVRFLHGTALISALATFSFAPLLIELSGRVKPYILDVFATLFLCLLAFRLRERRMTLRGAALGGGLGGILILLSFPAVIVGAGLGVVLLVQAWHDRPRTLLARTLALGAGWGVGAAVATALALRVAPGPTWTFMRQLWADGFPRGGGWLWLPQRIVLILGLDFQPGLHAGELVFGGIRALLATAGLLFLFRRRYRRGPWALLLVPPVVAILAAAIELLPFEGRLAVYAAPALLILSMAGAGWLARMVSRGRSLASVGVLLLGLAPVIGVLGFRRPPYRMEEIRPVLEELRSRQGPDDRIYVYHAADLGMMWYAPPLGIREWILGACHKDDPQAYLKEVDVLRGEPRVWAVFTHVLYGESRVIRSYLREIGVEKERIEDPYGTRGVFAAEAYLYDLSDPVRLQRATAEAFPVPPSRRVAECVRVLPGME